MAAGSVIVDLLLRTGSFETDTKRAEKRIRDFERSVKDSYRGIRDSFFGNVLARAAEELVIHLARIPDVLINQVAAFKDLEEITGGSAEGFASLGIAAATAGVSVESIANAANRLTKNLIGVDDESKAAGEALGLLGIPIKEFKELDPIGQIDALAKAFASFADGPNKSAVALLLWGKAGAEQLKVMQALAEQGGRQTILTQRQIELADEYTDRQAAATEKLKQLAQAAATEALPALIELTRTLGEVVETVLAFDKAAGGLEGENAIREFAEDAVVALAVVGEAVIGLGKLVRSIGGSFQAVAADLQFLGTVAAKINPLKGGAVQLLFEENRREIAVALEKRNKTVEEANARYEKLFSENGAAVSQQLRRTFDQQRAIRTDPELAREDARFAAAARNILVKPPLGKPGGGGSGGGGAKDDSAKRQLENQLRALESVAERERDIFESRNRFLEIFNSQGLLSIRSYYEAQRTIIEEATTAQATQIAKQIDVLSRFNTETESKISKLTSQRNKAGSEAREKLDSQIEKQSKSKAETEEKITKLAEQRSKIETDASEKVIALSIRETEEKRRLKIEIEGLNADVLELQGNLAAAASIRFDTTNADLERRLKSESNTAALAQLETLKRSTIAQAEFTSVSTSAARVLETLHQKEESIAIQRQLGVSTELSSQQQLSEARQSTVRELESIVAAQEAIATASGDNRLVEQAQRARLELEKLKATAEPLADAFDALFEEAFGDAFADFITGAATAEEAIKGFANSVVREISRIAAQNIAQSLFGKQGALGGLGNLAAQLFGGGGAPIGAAAPAGGAPGGAGRAATAAIGAATAAAGGDAAAAAAIGARTAAETASTAAIGANTAAQTVLTTASSTTTTGFLTLSTTGTATVVPALTLLATAAEAAASALASLATSASASSGASGADKAAGIIGTIAGFFTGGADPSFAGVGAAPYDVGGFTGNMPDATVAGVVHGGEFVFSAPTVRRIGVDALDRMHRAAKSGSKVPGFDAGGFVDRLDAMPNAPARDGGGDGGLHYFALGSSGYREGGPVGLPPSSTGQDRFSSIVSRSTSATTALGGYRVGGAVGGSHTHSASSARFDSAVNRSTSSTALLGYRSGGLVAFRDGTLVGFRDGGLASSSTSATASSERFSNAVSRSDSTTALLGYRAGGAVLLAAPREARGWRDGGSVEALAADADSSAAQALQGYRAGGAVRMLALAESAHPAFREGGAVGAHTHSASSDSSYRSALSSATSTSSFAAFRDGGAVRLLAGYRAGGAVRMLAAIDSGAARERGFREGGHVTLVAADPGASTAAQALRGRFAAASDAAGAVRGFREGGGVPNIDFSTFRYGGEVPDVQIAAPLFQAGGYVRPGTAAAASPGTPRAPISVTNNFAISGPIDRRTQDQISAATARGLQRSLRNT